MTDSALPLSVIFAGGGTGGHIFPNLAIAEHLGEARMHFVVSSRPLDSDILSRAGHTALPLPFKPPRWTRPWTLPRSLATLRDGTTACERLIADWRADVVIATGGFASVPAGRAAVNAGVPLVLINLDAVPGRANRMLAKRAAMQFTCYPVPAWPDARRIGLPLAARSIGDGDKPAARAHFNLDPRRDTLLVTGGSQGAETINAAMLAFVDHTRGRSSLRDWQVLHIAGDTAARDGLADDLRAAYEHAKIPAAVLPFCDAMGKAWTAASLAICRAGAGTVAEVWANAVPAVFLPYPFHRDQHQKLNAKPLVDAGSSVLLTDARNAEANARQLLGPLDALLRNAARRTQMTRQLRDSYPGNGAEIIAEWIVAHIGS